MNKMNRNFGLLLVWAVLALIACGESGQQREEVVNVYTHRHYDADQQLFDRFTAETDIRVNVVSASADELIQKLELEGEASPADVLITVDAGRLVRAEEKGLLQPMQSDILNQRIPAHLRSTEGYWFGLTYRARILAYHKERVDPATLSTYEALSEPEWKGRLLTRSSENIYNQSLLASMIATNGSDAARNWAEGVLGNMARPPKGSDRDQVLAVAAGEGDVAIVNTYYIGIMLNDSDEAMQEAAQQVGLFFPNQSDRGTHINVSGAGVTRHAPNRDNALRLIEFLTEPEAQQLLAEVNFEYPVNAEVPWPALLTEWGKFRADSLHLSELGKNNRAAVVLFDEIGWK